MACIPELKQCIIDDNFEYFKLLFPFCSNYIGNQEDILYPLYSVINKTNEKYIKWILDNIDFSPTQFSKLCSLVIINCSLDLLKYIVEHFHFIANNRILWIISMHQFALKHDSSENLLYLCQQFPNEMKPYSYSTMQMACYNGNLELCKFAYDIGEKEAVAVPVFWMELLSIPMVKNFNDIVDWFNEFVRHDGPIDNLHIYCLKKASDLGIFDDKFRETFDNHIIDDTTIQIIFKNGLRSNIDICNYLYSKYPNVIDQLMPNRFEFTEIFTDESKFKWYLSMNERNIDKLNIEHLVFAFSINSLFVCDYLLKFQHCEINDIINEFSQFYHFVNFGGMNIETTKYFYNKFGKDKLIELFGLDSETFYNNVLKCNELSNFDKIKIYKVLDFLYKEKLIDIVRIYNLMKPKKYNPDLLIWLYKKLKMEQFKFDETLFNGIINHIKLEDIIFEYFMSSLSTNDVLYDKHIYEIEVRSYLFY